MPKPIIIAVDFDGTIVEHNYPRIGTEVPGAIETIKTLQKSGAKLILLTMRSGQQLDEAVAWCAVRDLHFWAVNENPGQKHWTDSQKVYAHAYIEDAAVGCPLIYPENARPYVDWKAVRAHFIDKYPGLLT